MKDYSYVLETLQIERSKIIESMRSEERYLIFPEYKPCGFNFQERLEEMNSAIDLIINEMI